jgi:hypothetical protein
MHGSNGHTEHTQSVIVIGEGFRLNITPTNNEVYIHDKLVYIDQDYQTPHTQREITFNHPMIAHTFKIVDRSEFIPNPRTQKQREKVRELIFSNNAVVRGITYELVR